MSNTDVVPFYFNENEIRTVSRNNEPWFVAKDVCDVLDLENVTNALIRIPEHHLTLIRLKSGGQMREMKIVSEPGLYRLVLRCDKPHAEPFMEWVTEEVLPTIRKTGSYNLINSNSALDAVASQIIEMIVPVVTEKATAAIVGRISPMVNDLRKKVDNVQVNFSSYGTVWSFSYHCLQDGDYNTIVEKQELYEAYCAYCGTKPHCRPDAKTTFFTKLYRAFVNSSSVYLNKSGRKIPAVRGIGLLPGYQVIIDDLKKEREAKDAKELERRRKEYCGRFVSGSGE